MLGIGDSAANASLAVMRRFLARSQNPRCGARRKTPSLSSFRFYAPPVVYANAIQRTGIDDRTGDHVDITIPLMKGYTVFDVEQIERGPSHYDALRESSRSAKDLPIFSIFRTV